MTIIGNRKDIFDQLGFDNPVMMLAPMEGVTGPIFRKALENLGAVDVLATEFLRVTGPKQKFAPVVRGSKALQIQFMACDPSILSECIMFQKERGVLQESDWIDLNIGCPSKRVNSRGAGAALLLEPRKIVELSKALRSVHDGIISVKTRIGYQSTEEFPDIIAALSDCPIDFVTIHARTKAAKLDGPVSFDCLRKAVEQLPYPVIANGGIWTAADARKMLELTGVRGLMCGRGAIANPFIFNQIKELETYSSSEDSSRLRKFVIDILIDYEKASVQGRSYLGVAKEFLAWISCNPSLPVDLFQQVKRVNEIEGLVNLVSTLLESEIGNSFPAELF